MNNIDKLYWLMRISKYGVVTPNDGLRYPALHDPEGYRLYQYTPKGRLVRLDPEGTGMPTFDAVSAEDEARVLKKFYADELTVVAVKWTSVFGYEAIQELTHEHQ
jgi:hypothetical protein